MPPKSRRYKYKNSLRPFTVYIQQGHMDWVKTVAPPGGVSNFIDNLIYRAKERYEVKKIKAKVKRQSVRIAELQAEIIRLGGTVTVADVTEADEDLEYKEQRLL